MHIRPCADPDLPGLTELTIETFRPFYEGYVHPLLGEEVFRHQHGRWEQDYRDEVPTLHDPAAGRHVAVAQTGGSLAGYVAWKPGDKPNSGQIYLLAVSPSHRRRHVGRQLCLHAIHQMKADGVEFVEIGTGRRRLPRRSQGALREPRIHQDSGRGLSQEDLTGGTRPDRGCLADSPVIGPGSRRWRTAGSI